MDVLNGQNVHDPATWAYVWELAGSGKVIAIIGGPPCRSVSRMLEKQPGPPRLRGRDGDDRFGLPMLTEAQQQKTDGDTAMFLKQLGLYMHVEESWNPETWPHMEHVKNRVKFFLESPQDPKTYLPDGAGDESASFWAWDETLAFLAKYENVGMSLLSFDQGAFGHVRKNQQHACQTCPICVNLMGADPVRGKGILLCTWMSDCSRPQRGHCGLLVFVLLSAHRCWSWVSGMGWHHQSFPKIWGLNSGVNILPRVTNLTEGIVEHVFSIWRGRNHIGDGKTMVVLLGLWLLILFLCLGRET